jgi:ABC-type nitrate/sulfonate/bicarbonate transport system ATPase subunit
LADRVVVLTTSPASVQSIVAIETPRRDRTAPEVIDGIRRQIMQPAPSQ